MHILYKNLKYINHNGNSLCNINDTTLAHKCKSNIEMQRSLSKFKYNAVCSKLCLKTTIWFACTNYYTWNYYHNRLNKIQQIVNTIKNANQTYCYLIICYRGISRFIIFNWSWANIIHLNWWLCRWWTILFAA